MGLGHWPGGPTSTKGGLSISPAANLTLKMICLLRKKRIIACVIHMKEIPSADGSLKIEYLTEGQGTVDP